jgi:signal transduction histidine kinase
MSHTFHVRIHDNDNREVREEPAPVWGTTPNHPDVRSTTPLREPGVALLGVPTMALVLGVYLAPGPGTVAAALGWAAAEVPLFGWLMRRRSARDTADQPALGDVMELAFRAEAAEEALRGNEELLHELRATVVGITMAHQLLSTSDSGIQDATRDRLTALQDTELARLERLVVGVPERTSDQVELQDVVRPLADSLRLQGTDIECHGDAAATGRPDDITEIIHVLLANAARHAPGATVRVTLFETSTTAGVEVTDDGPGVPPEVASRLFERGSRGPDSPGHGLGLHIARSLAREMGGELTLEPTSNGATFQLTLPLSVGAVPCLAHSA